MDKAEEQKFIEHLESLSKDTIIDLYLQKCYDTNVEMEQISNILSASEIVIKEINAKLSKAKHDCKRYKIEIQRLKMEVSYEKEHKEKSYKYTEELRKQIAELTADNEKLIKNYDALNSKYCAEMDKVTTLQQQLKDNTNQVCEKIKIELFKKVAYMKNNNHEYIQRAVCWQDIVPIIDKIKKGGAE